MLDFFSIQASIAGILHAASGVAPEGTPGKLDINQIVPISAAAQNGGKRPLSDAAPVESIALTPRGR